MALASSGTMSIGGSTATRSINLELDRSAAATTSMGEAALRDLAEVSSGAISLDGFHGKTADSGYLPITVQGTNTVTDSSIPAQIQPINNVQITGTTYWRRARVTYSGTTGQKRFYVNGRRTSSSVANYRTDMQAVWATFNRGGTEYNHNLVSTGAAWQTRDVLQNTTFPTSGWVTVLNTNTNTQWKRKTTSGPTPSTGTGRLQNFINTSEGYMFVEGTSTGNGLPKYYWLRSPSYTFTTGDTVDFYYGVDCAGLDSTVFFIQ